ncbi:hypothetical protein VNO80_18723 [Phaseolus coccineus]|uniref:Uncharacterized protein n=1 Tax=Phaseolus coccineus TaxID=3886 RepID=A0AAN9MER3_PHACN
MPHIKTGRDYLRKKKNKRRIYTRCCCFCTEKTLDTYSGCELGNPNCKVPGFWFILTPLITHRILPLFNFANFNSR